MFKVYQNHSVHTHSDYINRVGWEVAAEKYAGVKSHLNTSLSGSKQFKPEDFEYYTHVANVDTDNLDKAFELMNLWENPELIENLGPTRSLSVGDILVDESGKKYMVESCGFWEVHNV